MATSQIVLYKTNITPERNCKVDDLGYYLISCEQEIISDFQYKTIKLDDTIKLNMSQNNTPNFPYNYLAIKRDNETKIYYYFIINSNWRSENTIELQISLDTINTFWNELSWTAKTNITRQHKDRFAQKTIPTSGNVTLLRDIDKFDEGISPIKYRLTKDKITTDFDLDFYLIYRTNPDADQTLECLCCASDRLQLGANAPTTNGISATDIPVGQSIIILGEENSTFDIEGTAIGAKSGYPGCYIYRQEGNTSLMSIYAISKNTATGIIIKEGIKSTTINSYVKYNLMSKKYDKNFLFLADAKYAVKHDTVASYTINSTYVADFSTVDRTDTKLVKIIKMPYAPFELRKNSSNQLVAIDGFYEQNHMLHLYNLDQEFLTTVDFQPINELAVTLPVTQINANTDHMPKLESKLFNSNYYTLKYIYDSFEKEFLLEHSYPIVGASGAPSVTILFKQSNNISSNSLFDIKLQGYDEPTTYGEYLNVNRQNEVALFTNDYLNYIRSGFNYEKKVKTAQNTANWIGAGVSLVGAAASFASSYVSGPAGIAAGVALTTSAVATLTSAITTTVNNEISMAQKLAELRRQSSSVSNTEDINLLSYYNGNRLLVERDMISDEVQKSIYELFRLTGYACNDYEIPNFNTRLHYNFVQCKAAFDESGWKYGQDFLNDIKSRFETGITVYHKVDNNYDWNQGKENFESWLASNG